jgi:hypothetical protein
MNALDTLTALADRHKRERSPNFPTKYIPKSKYNDKDANGLTACIVDWFTLNGHWATRLQSTGTYRNDIKKFVASQQRTGIPDVMGVMNGGHSVFIEVKVGRDCLSADQKQTISDLQVVGASVFVARDFQSFYDWFLALTASPDNVFDGATPFGFDIIREPAQRLTNGPTL